MASRTSGNGGTNIQLHTAGRNGSGTPTLTLRVDHLKDTPTQLTQQDIPRLMQQVVGNMDYLPLIVNNLQSG